jgi:hypothetical protein
MAAADAVKLRGATLFDGTAVELVCACLVALANGKAV